MRRVVEDNTAAPSRHIDNSVCQIEPGRVLDVDVIEEAAAAASILDPLRLRILDALVEPGSASTLAPLLGETRQKLNYHLHALEAHGLVTLVEERPRRGLTERVLIASARSYVVSPGVLGRNACTPQHTDRLSARYLIAVAARMMREVADLARRADRAGQALATLSIDTEIRFASAADRAAFTEQLTAAITSLAASYHDETAKSGRWHRLVVAAHPRPATNQEP